MSYVVLARRTRPQSLDELIGQEPISNSLKGMLEFQKIPHAFLFTGTRGTGKTSTARILAKSLNCEKGPCVSPCQTCRHCTQIQACSHEDVFEIDGASHTGVENIRELRESARFFPISAKYKIFIIDEVHMLSTGAFNALLKTLEEPPENVIFVLATTELHKVPVTIRSRCLTFAFKKISSQEICQHLEKILFSENVAYEFDALKLIAREGQGSLRDSLSLLEQVLSLRTSDKLTLEQTKQSLGLYNDEVALKLFECICLKQQAQALDLLQKSDEKGIDLSLIIESAAQYFRHALILKSTKKILSSLSLVQEEREILERHTASLDAVAISEIFKILSLAVKDMRRSTNPLNWAEIVTIDAISRADWISASDMLLELQGHFSSPKVSDQTLELSHNKVDLNLYKNFVEAAKKRSSTLGARLNVVKLDIFNKTHIKFADVPENTAFLSFDKNDEKFFWESLAEVGIQKEAVEGKKDQNTAISLHQIQEEDKRKALSFKEQEILSRQSVKNLMILSKEIQLTPIEN